MDDCLYLKYLALLISKNLRFLVKIAKNNTILLYLCKAAKLGFHLTRYRIKIKNKL